MSSPPPVCDPACQKIILNSSNIVALTRVLRQRLKDRPLDTAVGQEISAICNDADVKILSLQGAHASISADEKTATIHTLNHVENEVCRAQALFLKAVGYDGPTGKMLQ